MRLTQRTVGITIGGSQIRARRTTGGVAELWAEDDLALAKGLGYLHALDRSVQLMLIRIVGRGRLSECLASNAETLAADRFMRSMGFARIAEAESACLSPAARSYCEAYAAGVNQFLREHRRPWEFLPLGYKPEPWKPADTLLVMHVMSGMCGALTQMDMEKFLICALRDGVSPARLQKLFTPHLDGLDQQILELLERVRFVGPLVPDVVHGVAVPRSSNNWAICGALSASGRPIQCNDPHLECNRLPAAWYEAVMHTPDDYRIGITTPGVPGMIMGRMRRISLGLTYGYMDMVDYFIEECRGGRYRRGDQWLPLRVHEEMIRRKKGPPLRLCIFETDQGVLETEPEAGQVADGLYLARAWSCNAGGAAESMDALSRLWRSQTAGEAQQAVRSVSMSGNWVIADGEGNLVCQQTGRLPARKHSGLFPLPAWDADCRWQGFVPPEELSWICNPPEGILATANDDQDQPGRPRAINLSMGPYRAQRIRELLSEKKSFTPADMERIQTDLLSTQARRYMAVLLPLLPDTPSGRLLAQWDYRYDAASCGATLFESFYERLLAEVFGRGLFGVCDWEVFARQTCLLAVYFKPLDDAVLGDDPSWFEPQDRTQTFRRILAEVAAVPIDSVMPWGRTRRVLMYNILFGGVLPQWLTRPLGIDHGPIQMEGGRATVAQGNVIQAPDRLSVFGPTYRFIADLATDEARTALAGGPSGRPLSKWYTSDVPRWLAGSYKILRASERE